MEHLSRCRSRLGRIRTPEYSTWTPNQKRLSDLIGPVTWGTFGIAYRVLQPLLEIDRKVKPLSSVLMETVSIYLGPQKEVYGWCGNYMSPINDTCERRLITNQQRFSFTGCWGYAGAYPTAQ